jgi:hypothetical protein
MYGSAVYALAGNDDDDDHDDDHADHDDVDAHDKPSNSYMYQYLHSQCIGPFHLFR